MRPAYFQEMLDDFRVRCSQRIGTPVSEGEQYHEVARFLGIEPRTLRSYRHGKHLIPRAVEIIAVIMRHKPDITMPVIEDWIAEERRIEQSRERRFKQSGAERAGTKH